MAAVSLGDKPLVVIVGETASGKTALAIELAKQFDGEIICADSRTIYKGMDVGTAKPSKQEQAAAPHHLLDIIVPGQTYSAAKFKEDATRLIDEISARGKLPIIVGGTGLYIDSVLFDFHFSTKKAQRDPQNPRHLMKEKTPVNTSTNLQQLRPNTLVLGLKRDKAELEDRIEQRVDHMLKTGLVDEVKRLGETYGWESEAMSGICYRCFGQYIRGEISLEEAKAAFIKGDKNLAKRQRTWFKRNKYIHWLDGADQALPLVKTFLDHSE